MHDPERDRHVHALKQRVRDPEHEQNANDDGEVGVPARGGVRADIRQRRDLSDAKKCT